MNVEKPRLMDQKRAEEKRMASSSLPRTEYARHGNASSSSQRADMREEKKNQVFMKAQEKAAQEIDRRIEALQTFNGRISNARISSTDKNDLTASMQTEISNLNALKVQIANSTGTSTLKEAVQSITKSHRVFALVLPKGAITAAADRVNQIASQMRQLSTKLDLRIAEVRATGRDVTSLSTALAEINAKITDAVTKAGNAVTQIQALVPDNGDQSVQKSNKATLEEAHKKVEEAQKNLKDARREVEIIVKGLRAFGVTHTSPTTGTTTAQ